MIITLGIASSISSYKAAEILREFQKAGHTVRVAMTRNATRFVRPILFQSLSQHSVYLDEFRAKKGEVMHVDLARETGLIVFAPASANLIGKFAAGIADDFLTTFFLARRCPVLIAPAMNSYMYQNPVVQQNIAKLKGLGIEFVEPDEGYLACGDEGPGRLAPVSEIVSRALSLIGKSSLLSGRRVVITAGPTWEALDPVRVITNRSSGKMGYAVAEEAISRGADVVLISGPTQLVPPPKAKLLRVESAEQMLNSVLQELDAADYVIKTAAVSDFKPAETLKAKRKKTGRPESILLQPTEDILARVSAKKGRQIVVGFCAETGNLEQNAQKKLENKKLDFIVANLISDSHDPFQADRNEVLILDRLGGMRRLGMASKKEIASQLWDYILERAIELKAQPATAGSI
ncbi:bifunctional phosphopantothenoylcysteine decarboxylase/phosphopantothenate--cysteine ligase CoaBC [bacterium]|nr:bifunctional phosphopantothenoylcysteine decarboxylase/phosphopantothenate--cysteine ligase CoaBC [bacterium]MCI0602394.1 bifunctional phosphopantothenoylcysteine decarboxylase/phosphopantothenate--cysteine ligase CoaBC [bacterium]